MRQGAHKPYLSVIIFKRKIDLYGLTRHPSPKASDPKNREISNMPLLKEINELPKTAISFYPYLFRFIWIYFDR